MHDISNIQIQHWQFLVTEIRLKKCFFNAVTSKICFNFIHYSSEMDMSFYLWLWICNHSKIIDN